MYIIVDYSNIGEVLLHGVLFRAFVPLFVFSSPSQLWRPSLLVLHRFLLDRDGIFVKSPKNYLRILVAKLESFETSRLVAIFGRHRRLLLHRSSSTLNLFLRVCRRALALKDARSEHDSKKGILAQRWT